MNTAGLHPSGFAVQFRAQFWFLFGRGWLLRYKLTASGTVKAVEQITGRAYLP